jgi:hypothetical protein
VSAPEITHIEIRRVQNGFVVQALNIKVFEAYMGAQQPLRYSFVAKDIPEVATLLESIVTGGVDLNWIPSYELPIVDLTRRIPDNREG